MAKKTDKKPPSATIALNKKARHDFSIEEAVEAGLALQGWEVKSLREGRAQIKEAYVLIKGGEAYLFGAHFTPPSSTSTHKEAVPRRNRKLLLHRKELDRLIGMVERKGYTLVPLKLYWKRGMAKLEVGLAKGKKKVDKRADEKAKDWERQKARILRHKA